jgi:RNA polymerase sigma-70 factor (ECF subfamily)
MQLAQAGLREAFAVLVERHAARVLALCSRFAGDAQAGRELAQDAWVLVWQGREKYRAEGTFVSWLITVARNHCRNHGRRGSKGRETSELEALPADITSSSEQLDRLLVEERRRRVRSALQDLPVAMREALLLRYGEGLRYDQMTTIVGAGESTLRSRVHHGLRILKQKLEKGS